MSTMNNKLSELISQLKAEQSKTRDCLNKLNIARNVMIEHNLYKNDLDEKIKSLEASYYELISFIIKESRYATTQAENFIINSKHENCSFGRPHYDHDGEWAGNDWGCNCTGSELCVGEYIFELIRQRKAKE